MLSCEGHKMFYGTMLIRPKNPKFEPYEVTGTWLYKPYTQCWYANGYSYPKEICEVVEDTMKKGN